MTENEVAKIIVDCAFKVHTTLGPGLLESVYEAALAYELGKRGLQAERQKPLPVVYENVRLEEGLGLIWLSPTLLSWSSNQWNRLRRYTKNNCSLA
jgi:hypothetical protein